MRECATVDEAKLLAYLLDVDRPDGGPKARFFLSKGAHVGDWRRFREVLLEHARSNPVTRVRMHPAGRAELFQLDCQEVRMPDGSSPCIRTVWEMRPEQPCPRLVTAYPSR